MITLGGMPAHARIHGARQIDKAEHLEVPGGAPARFVDFENIPDRHRAGIVHQNIGLRIGLGQRLGGAALREIDRLCLDAPRGLRLDSVATA